MLTIATDVTIFFTKVTETRLGASICHMVNVLAIKTDFELTDITKVTGKIADRWDAGYRALERAGIYQNEETYG